MNKEFKTSKQILVFCENKWKKELEWLMESSNSRHWILGKELKFKASNKKASNQKNTYNGENPSIIKEGIKGEQWVELTEKEALMLEQKNQKNIEKQRKIREAKMFAKELANKENDQKVIEQRMKIVNEINILNKQKEKMKNKLTYIVRKNSTKNCWEIIKNGGKRFSFRADTKQKIENLLKTAEVLKDAIIIFDESYQTGEIKNSTKVETVSKKVVKSQKNKKESSKKVVKTQKIKKDSYKIVDYYIQYNFEKNRWEIIKNGGVRPLYTENKKEDIVKIAKISPTLKGKTIVIKKKDGKVQKRIRGN